MFNKLVSRIASGFRLKMVKKGEKKIIKITNAKQTLGVKKKTIDTATDGALPSPAVQCM